MKRIFTVTSSIVLFSASLAFAAADGMSFQSAVIIGLILGIPIFLPGALLVSVAVATGRAILRRRRQRTCGTHFGSTFLLTILACTTLYIVGMIIYLLVEGLISRI